LIDYIIPAPEKIPAILPNKQLNLQLFFKEGVLMEKIESSLTISALDTSSN